MVDKILTGFHPILMEPTIPFDFKAPKAETIAADLAERLVKTMLDAPGIGLAANQIGIPLRVFSFCVTDDENRVIPKVVFNPRYKFTSSDTNILEEGCLSFMDLIIEIERPKTIGVEYQDLYGNNYESTLTDLLARIWQHEMDHLDGVLFFNRALRIKRDAVLNKWRKKYANSKIK